jgi:hypothetical protein
MDFFHFKALASYQPFSSSMDYSYPRATLLHLFPTFVTVQIHDLKHKVLYRILAIMLLGVFIFNTTPRAFIHQFFPHHDTEDEAPVAKHGTAWSVKHVHCGFLQIEPEVYEYTTTFYHVPVNEITWHYAIPVIPVIEYQPHRTLPPRAPPAIALV